MSAIIIKAQQSAEITQNESLAAWQRVGQALKALSGLMLSDLSEVAKETVEAQLVAINQINSAYDIEVDADYEQLTDSDAAEILDHISKLTRLCIDSEAERVMQELATAGRKLPVAAIKEVREHRDVFVPLLIRALEQAIAAVRNGEEREDQTSFFAIFLLTELEVDEAFPILLSAFRLPGEGPNDLMGDAAHEMVGPAFAQFSRGDTSVFDAILEDPNVDKYVRWSVTHTYKYLVRDGLISRQDAVEELHRHFLNCVERGDRDLLAPLACELGDLAAESALESIRSAYERNLVDESVVNLKFIESQIAAGEATITRELEACRPTGMPDTIAELSRWASFREEEPPRLRKTPTPRPTHVPQPNVPEPHLPSNVRNRPQPVAALRAERKIGRNDPCPCGSGKKFKKCCR